MIESFRFIGLESQDAGMNMAIDEAIMNSRREDRVKDTFRLYRWKPSAVSIGFFQSIADELMLLEELRVAEQSIMISMVRSHIA